MHKFTSPDGEFQFRYSDFLVQCIEDKTQAGWWIPDDSCEAYFPMCNYQVSEGGNTLVCFAFRRSKFKDFPTFEAGTFSVARIKDVTTQKDCLSLPAGWAALQYEAVPMKTLNGAKFEGFDVNDAGMSQGVAGRIYRNFHEGNCYELSVRIATVSIGASDPAKINAVRGRLEQSLDSFRFLK